LHNFDVVKPVRELHLEHECPACGHDKTERLFSSKLYFNGAKVEDAEFNPGLGKVTKNSKHRKELASRMGLVEVGNETPDTIYKETTQKREAERAREWKDL
jgi:hypothetical protein